MELNRKNTATALERVERARNLRYLAGYNTRLICSAQERAGALLELIRIFASMSMGERCGPTGRRCARRILYQSHELELLIEQIENIYKENSCNGSWYMDKGEWS